MKNSEKKTNSSEKAESTKKEAKKVTTKGANPVCAFYKKNRILSIGILLVMLSFLSGYYLKGFLIAATVNGKPIWRAKIVKQMEKYYGANILDYLVTQELIQQEATNKGITITEKDIEDELNQTEEEIKASGTTLEKVLQESNMTMEDLKDNLKTNLITERLLLSRIIVSDEEVQSYIDENKDSFPEDTDMEQIKSIVSEQLKQEKMATEYQTLTAELKEKSNVKVLVEY